MQRVDELDSPPVVGRWYLVPCIHLTRSEDWGSGTGWWPTIGPIHEDKELIGFKPRHVHLDPRFLTPTQLARHLKERGPIVARSPAVDNVLAAPVCFDHPEKGVLFPEAKAVYRRRRCFYVMPNWRALVARHQELIGGVHADTPPWMAKLEAAYADKQIKPNCRVCPHRAFPLSGLPVKEERITTIDGNCTTRRFVECPGHGLLWEAETGRLLRRCKLPANKDRCDSLGQADHDIQRVLGRLTQGAT